MQQKHRMILLAAVGLALAVLHGVELGCVTDPTTGFYIVSGRWPWLLCGGCILATVVLGIVLKKGATKAAKQQPLGGWLLPVAAWAVAGMLTYELCVLLAVPAVSTTRVVVTALAAVFFACCGTFYGQVKAMPMLTRFFAVPLAAYHLVDEFLSTKGMAITAEHVYALFFSCFLLIAYVALAKVMCLGATNKNGGKLLCWGTAAALMAVLCTLPACGLVAFDGATALHGGSLPPLSDLAVGVFPLLYALKMLHAPKAAPAVVDSPAAEPPAAKAAEQPPAPPSREDTI